MGTAGAEKTRFTCLLADDTFATLKAKTLNRADKRTGRQSNLIIRGTAGDIDVRRVSYLNGGSRIEGVREELEEGTICTITVGDPVRITGATYCGKQKINGDKFLAFTKNGISFWLYWLAPAYLKT